MRLGAATAIPTLAGKLAEPDNAAPAEEARCGLYTVRLPGKRTSRQPEQVYFDLAGPWHWTIDD